MDGLADSLDLVPIAAWRGKGKRSGVYGAYLLACYDPEAEVWQAITKIGTGFSEEMLATLTDALNEKGCARDEKPKACVVSDAFDDADVGFEPVRGRGGGGQRSGWCACAPPSHPPYPITPGRV